MSTLNVVEAIFMAALEKETAEARAAYLAEACAGDASLHRCVERLLSAHARADSVLPTQAPGLPATTLPPPIEERPGSIVGPYKLLQQLGEGGFGVVFMAEQEQPIRRKVAFKIIKPGMDSKQVVARFEQERQALAQMDHPNIARVLDGGTTQSGRPYFVMELVKGVPITEFCDQNRLSPRERLELFVPVCQAVQHAHQKGIIHRDLKPSNILVTLYDDKPVPKVIDFGVAKAIEQKLTEQTLFTRVGQVIGTLEYMSPEQASLNALDVDTRADVYALGVLLYELLTGSTPLNKVQFEGVAFMEMLRLIRETEPPRPSMRLSALKDGLPLMAAYRRTDAQKLPKLVAGELDWIAMKALDKDRTRRYETASALAADVRRYLSEEPVEARPPSAWYRFRKLARRNRAVVTAGALVAAALVLGTVVAWLFALEAGRNAAWAYKEKENADNQTVRALANEKTANDRAEEIKKINADLLSSQDDLRHALYAADLKLIQHAWDTDHVGRVVELLKAQIPRSGQKDLRHFEWQYWDRLMHGAKKIVELKGGEPGLFAEFSPDRKLLASVAVHREQVLVRLWDTATGEVFKNLVGPVLESLPKRTDSALIGARGQFAFSADRRYLAAIIVFPSNALGGLGKPKKGPSPSRPLKELWVWDLNTGKKQWHKSMEFSRSDRMRGRVTFEQTGDRLAAFVVNPDSKEDVVQVFASGNGKLLKTLSVPEKLKKDGNSNVPIGLSPDWKRLLVSQPFFKASEPPNQPSQKLLTVWDLVDKKVVYEVSSPNGGTARVPTFSPNGKQLAIHWAPGGLTKGQAQLWIHDAATGKALHSCQEDSQSSAALNQGPMSGMVQEIEFSPDGNSLLGRRIAFFQGIVNVWDTATGKLRHKVLIPAQKVYADCFSADGPWLHLTAGNTVQVWPADRTAPFRVSAEPDEQLKAWSLSRDGRRLVVVVQSMVKVDGESFSKSAIRVLDTTSGKELLGIKDLPAPVTHLQLNADGTRLAAHLAPIQNHLPKADGSEVIVWDVDSGKKIGSCSLPVEQAMKDKETGQPVHQFEAFNTDGTLAAVTYLKAGGERVLKVWKMPSGEQLAERTYKERTLGWFHFSQDSRFLYYKEILPSGFGIPGKSKWRLVNTPEVFIHVLDLKENKNLPLFALPGRIHRLMPNATISPDGNRLAIYGLSVGPYSKAGELMMFDLKGKTKHRLLGHTQKVLNAVFSPDGKRLVSLAAKPGKLGIEIKVWDVHNGQEVLNLTEPALRIGTLQFSSDGHRLFLVNPKEPISLDSSVSAYELHTWDATPIPGSAP
jgi:serine/threonine protein kinase/WD40 repeat protein